MEAYVFSKEDQSSCSHCQMSVHRIDVFGRKFTEEGIEVPYQICRGCCSMIRYFNFHKDAEKIQNFWHEVWTNIDVPISVEVTQTTQAGQSARASASI